MARYRKVRMRRCGHFSGTGMGRAAGTTQSFAVIVAAGFIWVFRLCTGLCTACSLIGESFLEDCRNKSNWRTVRGKARICPRKRREGRLRTRCRGIFWRTVSRWVGIGGRTRLRAVRR